MAGFFTPGENMASENLGDLHYEVDIETAKMMTGSRKASVVLDQMSKNANSASNSINKTSGSLNKLGKDAGSAATAADKLQTSINKVAGAIAVSIVAEWGKAFIVAADNMTQLTARIERLTGSAATAAVTMQNLMRISSDTGGSLQDTAKLWETLGTALRDTGATNGQILQLTETLQKIGRIGGSSSEEMANALRQFGKSISSGVVRAEEFNSILEQMPELARQMAAGLGVSMGQLRQMMLDGKLTAQDALNAIQKQTSTVNTEFEKLPRTLSQANTALTNSLLTLIDNINQTTGASNGLVSVIDSIAAAMDRLSGNTVSAAAQISDLNSTAEMFQRRARTWSWLGIDGWEAQSNVLAGLSNKAAMLVGDMAAVSKAANQAANTKPIEIKATATGKTKKAGKSQEQKDAEQYAKAQENVAQKLEELRQKADVSANSIGELSRAQAILNAQQSLGNSATQDQLALAGQLAGKAWDNANALRAQAKAEKERAEASTKFSAIQGKTSKVAGIDSQFQKDMNDINLYAQLYPQKIAEAEAARLAIETQYRQQRTSAMFEEWSQLNLATQVASAAFTSFGNNASNAFTGILTGSMSAEQAIHSLVSNALNSAINAVVQWGIDWVKSAMMGQTAQVAAVATSTAAQTAGIATTTAASTAAAATTTAAWTPAAIVASIGSFGGAAAIGLAAVLGALAIGVAGKRKNGGPVSSGSMYQVGEGGMPEIYQASNGSQYMIPGDNGKVISNKDLNGGGGQIQVSIQFNDYSSGAHSYDAQATQNGDYVTINAFIMDMDQGGQMSQSITRNIQAQRRARE
ncbi:tape measure domain protein [Yokenella regensburgei ATCC 43003]|nr:tape measure domain protein [Yokenella regensburgei ATCC 43003]